MTRDPDTLPLLVAILLACGAVIGLTLTILNRLDGVCS